MDVTATADAVERLKRHGSALASCQVIDAAGVATLVAVPKLRTKWARLERTFEELGWRQIKALDKDGSLLELYDLLTGDEPEELLEELPDDMANAFRFAERVSQLCLNAQKAALSTYVAQNKTMMDGMAKLVGVLTDRLVSLERMFGKTLKLAHDSALGPDDGDEAHSGTAIMDMLGRVMFNQAAVKAKAAEAAAASSQTASPKNGEP